MVKKILFFLLKKYTRREEGRLEVFAFLNEQVKEEYREQSVYGNVYNSNAEFIMSNELIKKLVSENNEDGLNMIKRGLSNSVDEAIQFIEDEMI